MKRHHKIKPGMLAGIACLLALTFVGTATLSAAKKGEPQSSLTASGNALASKYEGMLKAAQAEIGRSLPKVDATKQTVLQKAREGLKKAEADADSAKGPMAKVSAAAGAVDHAKGKWIGGAEKGIVQAQADLKKATTDAQREAAKKALADWQKNKEDGLKALKERQAALESAKAEAAKSGQAAQQAQEQLAKVRAAEQAVSKAVLAESEAFLSSDKLDAPLVKGAVLAGATPRGLAEFAQQGREQESLVDKLLTDYVLMRQMLAAGGAKFGKYGRAMEIYTAIQKASPRTKEGVLQRLALAVSLEHAEPIPQSNVPGQTDQPSVVDPVKRYMHYERAYLIGELDPAFKNMSVWEYRMVVGCDAPDQILAWGRAMLRNYRPDHIYNSNYGWRYSAAVKTEVPYGSQNVQYDRDDLHKYQNIVLNGGVCGRRAFFGRFILQAFGIPTWGVTQKAHAALSHWTPKGWVVNLGAGFEHSWWDKDEAPRSGSDFLLETQAREHEKDYMKVLRAKWVSAILGEQAYNDRRNVVGGYWSGIAHYYTVALASKAVNLGPLGQELGEANESKENEELAKAELTEADQKIIIGPDGVITIPAVAHSVHSGRFASMKSISDGFQVHAGGGFKSEYDVSVPRAGKYALSIRVATAQMGQKFVLAVNNGKAPVEIPVPYTTGIWQQTPPVVFSLNSGKNSIDLSITDGSRGVSIKDLSLTPVK